MFILSLAGLAIFIFLLNLLQWMFQQWITAGTGSINEKITIIVSSVTAFFAFLAGADQIEGGLDLLS
jgi:ABC-type nickel/cobalt efflux system permease component RcnA